MLYAKLAYKNVRASFHDYLLYFLTLALTVSLFYCFNASSTLRVLHSYNDLPASFPKLLDMLGMMMYSLSLLTAAILAVLVFYANRLFILRRKNEFALYYVLGMKQKHLSLVLFLEAFFVAILALGAGMLIGILASQFIFTFTASLFVNHVVYRFFFSPIALLFTVIAFFTIFMITTLANTLFLIFRPLRPIHFRPKQQMRFFSKLPPFIELLLAFLGYLLCFLLMRLAISRLTFLITILLMNAANFFILLSLCQLLSLMIRKRHSFCYQGLHLLTLRRIHQLIINSRLTLCIISILLTIGITSLFSGFCISNNLNSEVDSLSPYSFSLIHRYAYETDQNYHWKQFDQEVEKLQVAKESIHHENILHTFYSEFTYRELEQLLEKWNIDVPRELAGLSDPIEILPLSAYNQLRREQGFEELKLKPENVLLYSSHIRCADAIKQLCESRTHIRLFHRSFRLQPSNGKPLRPSSVDEYLPQESILIVIHDTMIPANAGSYADYWNVELKSGISTRSFASSIEKAIVKNGQTLNMRNTYMANRDETHDNSVGFSVLYTYVSLYIGTILIICSLITLSLKLLAPIYNERSTAALLEKIGTPLQMCRKDLFWQTFVYFSLPFCISIVNSMLLIKIIKNAYYEFHQSGYVTAVAQTTLLVSFLFISYFAITNYSRRSMAENEQLPYS